jgi:hypothetical protein
MSERSKQAREAATEKFFEKMERGHYTSST